MSMYHQLKNHVKSNLNDFLYNINSYNIVYSDKKGYKYSIIHNWEYLPLLSDISNDSYTKALVEFTFTNGKKYYEDGRDYIIFNLFIDEYFICLYYTKYPNPYFNQHYVGMYVQIDDTYSNNIIRIEELKCVIPPYYGIIKYGGINGLYAECDFCNRKFVMLRLDNYRACLECAKHASIIQKRKIMLYFMVSELDILFDILSIIKYNILLI